MAPDPEDRYFGYSTNRNTRLLDLWETGRRMGEDLRHYPPRQGDGPPGWTRDPSNLNLNDEDARRSWSNNNSVELIYDRVMAQNPEDVERMGAQWQKLADALGALADRIRLIANGLRYGGDGSPDGTGWTGAGADAFLARGPGATIKSLDDWTEAAQINADGAMLLADSIRHHQEIFQRRYQEYQDAMIAARDEWWRSSDAPGGQPNLENLAQQPPEIRQSFVEYLRGREAQYREEFQRLQYSMAEQYRTDLRSVNGGRATIYEGPRDAVREDYKFIIGAMTPSPPGLSPPGIGATPGVPPPPTAPVVPPAPTPPGTPNPGATPPAASPAVPVAPAVPDPGAPAAPAVPVAPVPVAPVAPVPPVAPGLPPGGRAPVAPGLPGAPPGGGLSAGTGGRGTVPGVLRNGLSGAPPEGVPPGGSRPPGTPGMPLSRSPQRPDGSPPGTPQVVGPQPEPFGDSAGTTPPPPPVLRAPQSGGPPSGTPTRGKPRSPGSGAGPADAGGPPSGVAPPVLNRPRPSHGPEVPASRRRAAPPSSFNQFLPPTVPGGPVLGRTPPAADGPEPVRPSTTPTDGVVRARRAAADTDRTGFRFELAGRAVKSKVDEEYEKLRAILLGEDPAFQVSTPGGGVVTTPPSRPVDTVSEPKAQLRGGAA